MRLPRWRRANARTPTRGSRTPLPKTARSTRTIERGGAMRTAVYVQDANDPDRRVLAGNCDLPRTLNPRVLASFPFAHFGIAPDDVASVEMREIGGKRACVIFSTAPVACPDLVVTLIEEIAEAAELMRPHFPADDQTTLENRAKFFRPHRYQTGHWPDFEQIAKDEAAMAEAVAQKAAAKAAISEIPGDG